MTIISTDIHKAATFLKEGKLVAIPTETVYGLAANIFDEKAVKSIFELKKRPLFNPLIVHIHNEQQLNDLTTELPSKAKQLMKAFWPGALTLVLNKNSKVPDLITAGKDTVAVRMPKHPTLIKLLQQIPFPLAAPSANPFNAISPTNAQRVKTYFDGQLEMVLDGGSCDNGIESTIIGFDENEVIIYRLGAISVEDIEEVVGSVKTMNQESASPNAPGMLLKHYSPSTPTILVEDLREALSKFESKKIGVLCFKKGYSNARILHQEILSEQGNLEEATANLYEALHRLDEQQLDLIIAEKLPNYGLGKSINDRLGRASYNE